MIITRLLAGGIKLWLRSQLTETANLKVKIGGKDRQIVTGYVPEVFIAANSAQYQKIALSQVAIEGKNLRFNLTEIIKSQPFRLLEPISVTIKLCLTQSDLQASLASTLLSEGLTNFWHNLLQETNLTIAEEFKTATLIWQQLSLEAATLKLQGIMQPNQSPIRIIAGLTLANPQTLLLSPVTILGVPGLSANSMANFAIDLGDHVCISDLNLGTDRLFLTGSMTIFPT
ncbi:MAG TPA: DUF2993 domain-containing protein [Xenococcaceae cyanobacterium]